MKPKSAAIKCPTCQRRGDWFAGAYAPFCSRRCQLVDLGKWFGEEHMISHPLAADNEEPSAASDLGPGLREGTQHEL